MRLAVRKLQVEDAAKLQSLVVENFDAIEPGLSVLDARLLLGHSTIDVIGVDATGSLVLGAIGFTANEEMLLKAVETYSWCLEYPESLVRHYPSCQVSEDRPPRLLFVVERVPDAFHRKIKQLGFPEVDCVEVRHLEFDGVPAVYFETLLRLRRAATPGVSRAIEPEGAASNQPAETAPARKPAVKLQRSSDGSAERPVPSREHPPVVSMVSRQATATARIERPRPAAEPLMVAEPAPLLVEPDASPAVEVPVAAPLAAPVSTAAPVALGTPLSSVAPAEPRVSFKDLASTLLAADASSTAAAAPVVEEPAVERPFAQEIAPSVTATAPQPEATSAAVTVEALVAKTAPMTAPGNQPLVGSTAKQPPMPGLPQEFEGLKFPNDGVLTRQWMEFLNQMSGSK